MDSYPSYANLNACTLVQEPNSTYLSHTSGTPTIATPLSGPTMSLMMLMSTLQYQAPYVNPAYSNAAAQAGKAAFVETGGQAMQDRFIGIATTDGKNTAHSIGLTDTELGIFLISAKTLETHQLSINGPRIYSVKTSLTAKENSGSIGLKWDFK